MTTFAMPESDHWAQTADSITATYSALTLHRKCPQAWYYSYALGLREDTHVPTARRDLGSWFGAFRAVEALDRGRALGSLLAEPRSFRAVDDGPEFDQRTVNRRDVFDAMEAWWVTRPEEYKAAWYEEIGEYSLPTHVQAMFDRWIDRYGDEVLAERPLGVEVKWTRQLPRPKADAAWDPTFGAMPALHLLGYADEVLLDARGVLTVRDVKSNKSLDNFGALDDMMDSQLYLYGWGVSPLTVAWGLGNVRAVSYDRARSTAPKEPTVTATGALSKSVTDYDRATYERWAAGPDGRGVPWGQEGEYFKTGKRAGEPKFGRYLSEPEVIERLSTEAWKNRWHLRTQRPVSRHLVIAHLRAAVDSAAEIWRTQQRARTRGEASRHLVRQTCGYCQFQSLCRAQIIGGAEGEYDLAEHSLVAPDGRRMLEFEAPAF